MNRIFGLIGILFVCAGSLMGQQRMVVHYSTYTASSYDEVSRKLTTTVTVQGNTTFDPSCSYCYSAYHTAYATNQISRHDNGVVIAGGWRQMLTYVSPPSTYINVTSNTSFDPFDPSSGPGPWDWTNEGGVDCNVAGQVFRVSAVTLLRISNTSWGPKAIVPAGTDDCHYTSLACAYGTPTCTIGEIARNSVESS